MPRVSKVPDYGNHLPNTHSAKEPCSETALILREPTPAKSRQATTRARRIVGIATASAALGCGAVALAATPALAAGYGSGSAGATYGGWGYVPPPPHHRYPFPPPHRFPFPIPKHHGHTTGYGKHGYYGPGTVLTSCWKAGNCTGKYGHWSFTVQEPQHSLPGGTQTVITNESSSSSSPCFGVSFYRDGNPINGPSGGVPAVISGVQSGQTVEEQSGNSWKPVRTTVSGGRASFSATGNQSYVLTGTSTGR
jgi:hypothetical protein